MGTMPPLGWMPIRLQRRRSLRRNRRLLRALPCLFSRRWLVLEVWEACLTWEEWEEVCRIWVVWEVPLQMRTLRVDPLLRRLTKLSREGYDIKLYKLSFSV